MKYDGQMNPFDKPIVFRREDRPGDYYHTEFSSLPFLSLCPYAKLGDKLLVEGRFQETEKFYELMCSRIILPDRVLEGVVQEMPTPQMTYPYVPGNVACIKDKDGFEIALTDAEGNFIPIEGGFVTIADQSYPINTNVTVRGDIVQGYKLDKAPLFYHIHAVSTSPTELHPIVGSDTDVHISVSGTTLLARSEREIQSAYVYDVTGKILFSSSGRKIGRELHVNLKGGGSVFLFLQFVDGVSFTRSIAL